jgi:hypothetical protein
LARPLSWNWLLTLLKHDVIQGQARYRMPKNTKYSRFCSEPRLRLPLKVQKEPEGKPIKAKLVVKYYIHE